MSAPPSSRGSRTTTRSRGSARGGSQGRGVRNHASQQQSKQAQAPGEARNTISQPYTKPPKQQNQQQDKSRNQLDPNGVQLSSAILSHAGAISASKDQPWRNAAEQDSNTYKQRMNDLYQTLKEYRERERRKAIKDGFLADPEKPTSLANAITPVGTCLDMCPEFERVERIVQLMVDANEKVASANDAQSKVPCENLMVKRFRRSAAGYDEQLPSDIRPPAVLQKTLSHLFESVIGGPDPLANTHKFVWDRTRGIRNDFSIQQVTRVEDLKIAIDCFERIARFHILSLHQLSHPDRDNGEFDHHQEREQLNNTLLSLMYYYEDSRHKLRSPNEAEFRAYCVIFEIQDQQPDLEDRAQNWPGAVLKDMQVKTALKLYAAAGNTLDEQGPLRPRTPFSIAQANTRGFFELVQSHSVSYIMACVAEIYFNLVRTSALESIWTAYKGKRPGAAKVEDWSLEDITYAFGFDNSDQSRTFCEEHEFEIVEREDGEEYVNLGSVVGSGLKDNNSRRKQIFSRYLVESKRLGRSFTAVINGLCVSDAQAQGLVDDSDADNASVANSESLFINEDAEVEKRKTRSRSSSPLPPSAVNANGTIKLNGAANPFNPTTFGLPSSKPNPFKPVKSIQTESEATHDSGLKISGTDQASNSITPQGLTNPMFSSQSEISSNASATSSSFSGKEALRTNFFSVSNGSKTQESSPEVANATAEEQKPANAPADGSLVPQRAYGEPIQAAAAPNFSFETSPLFPQHALEPATDYTPTTNVNQDHSKANAHTQSPNREPVLPFETSPTFQFTVSEVQVESQPSPRQPQKQSPPSFRPSRTSSTYPPQLNSITPSSPFNHSSFPSSTKPINSPWSTSSSAALNAPTSPFPPAFSFNTPNYLQPTKSSTSQQASEPSTTAPASLLPASSSFPVPKAQQTQSDEPSPATSPASSMPSIAAQFSPQPVPPRSPLPNPRPATLDKATDGLMFDDGGLVQQYIESSIAPIMKSAIAQFEKEESWREARNYRVLLLARKYLQKWKLNAWKLGLTRRGRIQRQRLAKSMQGLAKKQEEVDRLSFLNAGSSRMGKEKAAINGFDSMPPPAIPKDKRQSLPSNFGTEVGGAIQTPRRNKRKLDDTGHNGRVKILHPPGSSHKRSNTVGFTADRSSTMSAPPHRVPRVQYRQNIDTPGSGNVSAVSDTVAKHARQIVSETLSDTTQTDYFRLKALGIDPDTPLVPLTSKNGASSDDVNGTSNTLGKQFEPSAGASSATKRLKSQSPITTRLSVPDDDEDFFASIRAIRSTLSDSTSWFQAERESIERSITPSQASASPPSTKNETAAERRLRQIRERGHTQSRSEVRLRAMGNRALLPEGFWDEKGLGESRSSGKQVNSRPTTAEKVPNGQNGKQHHLQSGFSNDLVGFAALVGRQQSPKTNSRVSSTFTDQDSKNFMVNGFGPHGNIQDQQSQHGGATSEEVIELSD